MDYHIKANLSVPSNIWSSSCEASGAYWSVSREGPSFESLDSYDHWRRRAHDHEESWWDWEGRKRCAKADNSTVAGWDKRSKRSWLGAQAQEVQLDWLESRGIERTKIKEARKSQFTSRSLEEDRCEHIQIEQKFRRWTSKSRKSITWKWSCHTSTAGHSPNTAPDQCFLQYKSLWGAKTHETGTSSPQ